MLGHSANVVITTDPAWVEESHGVLDAHNLVVYINGSFPLARQWATLIYLGGRLVGDLMGFGEPYEGPEGDDIAAGWANGLFAMLVDSGILELR